MREKWAYEKIFIRWRSESSSSGLSDSGASISRFLILSIMRFMRFCCFSGERVFWSHRASCNAWTIIDSCWAKLSRPRNISACSKRDTRVFLDILIISADERVEFCLRDSLMVSSKIFRMFSCMLSSFFCANDSSRLSSNCFSSVIVFCAVSIFSRSCLRNDMEICWLAWVLNCSCDGENARIARSVSISLWV